MRLLLIEDDEYKAAQICGFLETEGYQVDVQKSFQSGMRAVLSRKYGLLLLDMSIPTFDGVDSSGANRHRPFGGKDVLQELKRLGMDIPVIVVTQYSVFGEGRDNITLHQLDENLNREFKELYWEMIYFNASSLQTGLVNDTEIEYCAELDEAVKKLKRTRYDLVLLDIMLPARMGMSQIPNGGSMVLKCLTEMDAVKKPLCVIGLTVHDELLETCEQEFTDNLFCLIKYQSDSAGWKKQIERKVKWLAESQKQLVEEYTCAREYEYDFAIITAVDVEMQAVLALDFEWQEYQIPFDQDTYYIAEKEIENHQVKVVLARTKNMGMTAAATVTTKVISWFKPRYVSMIGITGGREGEVQLGDVILAKTSWDYGSGKWKQEEANEYVFLPDPNFITISSGLQSLFLKNYDSVLRNIRVEWNSQTRQNICMDNHLVVGPLASGAAVIQNDEILHKYIEPYHRKVLGVDMETYGVYYACQNAFLPTPEFFSIKAVSDFANSRKNDGYQEYCAFLSAHFLMELIRELMGYRR